MRTKMLFMWDGFLRVKSLSHTTRHAVQKKQKNSPTDRLRPTDKKTSAGLNLSVGENPLGLRSLKSPLGLVSVVMAWLGIAMLHIAAPTWAGETVPYTLAQRTQKAAVIVIAEVESMSSNWDDEGREIYTYITLRVVEKIKGTIEGNQIVLRQLGGIVGNVESRVSGMPQFARREKVLVFLGRYPSSPYFGVMDWLEGKKTIQYNAAGQETVSVGTRGESSRLLKEYIDEIQAMMKQK
jgi:hypothetical protein